MAFIRRLVVAVDGEGHFEWDSGWDNLLHMPQLRTVAIIFTQTWTWCCFLGVAPLVFSLQAKGIRTYISRRRFYVDVRERVYLDRDYMAWRLHQPWLELSKTAAVPFRYEAADRMSYETADHLFRKPDVGVTEGLEEAVEEFKSGGLLSRKTMTGIVRYSIVSLRCISKLVVTGRASLPGGVSGLWTAQARHRLSDRRALVGVPDW